MNLLNLNHHFNQIKSINRRRLISHRNCVFCFLRNKIWWGELNLLLGLASKFTQLAKLTGYLYWIGFCVKTKPQFCSILLVGKFGLSSQKSAHKFDFALKWPTLTVLIILSLRGKSFARSNSLMIWVGLWRSRTLQQQIDWYPSSTRVDREEEEEKVLL